jgi:hypothetical protein
MSIAYISTTAAVATTLQDATDWASNGSIVTISRASPDKLQIWSTSTLTYQASAALTNNNLCSTVCTMGASAFIWTSTTNMDVVNLNNNYKVNYTGTTATVTTTKGQQSAGIASANLVIATSGTANTLNKFNTSTFVAGTQTINALNSGQATTILALTNSFLIGTNVGLIIEIDTSFNVLKTVLLPVQLNGSTTDRDYVTGLSYSNGVVYAATANGRSYQLSWLTQDVLNSIPFSPGSATLPQGSSFCSASSGTTLYGQFNSGASSKINNLIAEVDFEATPPKTRAILFLGNITANIQAVGLQGNTGWCAYASALVNFTVIPRFKSNQTVSLLDNSTYHLGRRFVIIDDGNTLVESDITVPNTSGTVYTISSGKSVIDTAFYNTGVSKRGSVAKYNT